MLRDTHEIFKPSRLSAFLHLLGRFFEIQTTIGLLNALKLFLGHRCRGEYSLRLPFLRAPLYLRGRSSDPNVFRKVFIHEEYHVPGQKPRLIIDAGANVGISAVYFANLYPDATILCIEPEPSNVLQFRKNTQAYPNIRLIQGALWSRSANLAIINPSSDKVSFVVKEVASGTPGAIPGYGINELLPPTGAQRIDILKIDIEGSEAEVFAGDIDAWLSKVGILLIELHEDKVSGCGRTFFSACTRHSFQYHQRGENMVLTRAA